MSSKPVEPAAPPTLVTRAYWLWTISGALMGLYGIALIIVSVIEGAGGFVAIGIFFTVIGAVLIFAARKAFPGDQQWRSALAVFTLMLVALGIMGSLLIKHWVDASLVDVVRLWAGAQDAVEQPLAVRVRAATAIAPFLR